MGLSLSSTWQVQEAKSRFSEVLERARQHGPQTITRHGKPVARVVPIDDVSARGEASAPVEMSFTEFLLNAPKFEAGLPERPRDRSVGRPPMFGEE